LPRRRPERARAKIMIEIGGGAGGRMKIFAN
jgi:hypothetical protein